MEAEEVEGNSPVRKKTCHRVTPKGMRRLGSSNAIACVANATSTPKGSVRSLKFEKTSNCMRVEHLPRPFLETLFKRQLEKVRLKHGICPTIASSVVNCDYRKEDNTAVIEFISPEIPAEFVKLKNEHFMKNTLGFAEVTIAENSNLDYSIISEVEDDVQPLHDIYEHATVENIILSDDDEKIEYKNADAENNKSTSCKDNGAQEENNNNVAQLSNGNIANKAVVSQLPECFDKDYLMFCLNQQLWDFKNLPLGTKCISQVTCDGATSAIVEFTDPDYSALMCDIGQCMFLNEMIFVKKYVAPQSFTEQDLELIHTDDVDEHDKLKAVVSQLPEGFDKDYLMFCLNKQLWDFKKLPLGTKCISQVTCDGATTAIVEFTDPDYSALMCDIGQCMFLNEMIFVNKYVAPQSFTEQDLELIHTDDVDEHDKLKAVVSQLPEGFDKDYLMFCLNKQLWDFKKLPLGTKCISQVTCDGATSAIVEFTDPDFSALMCDIGQCMFLKEIIFVNKYVAPQSFTEQGLELIYMDDVHEHDKLKAVVSQLPEGFDKDYLLFCLNERLLDLGNLPVGTRCISQVTSDGSNSAIIEFQPQFEVEASILLDEGKIMFCGKECEVLKYRNKSIIDWKKLTNQVEVVNLPGEISDFELLYVLNSTLWEVDSQTKGQTAALRCSKLIDGKYIVDCSNIEMATKISLLPNVVIRQQPIVLIQVEECSEDQVATSKNEKHLYPDLGSLCIGGTDALPIDVHSDAGDGLKKKEIHLKTDEGDVIFLRKMVLLMQFFTGSNHDTGYTNLLYEVGLEGVVADIPALRKRRRNFLDLYTRNKRMGKTDYIFQKPLSVIFGNESSNILKGTEFDVSGEQQRKPSNPADVAEAVSTYCEGAVFTTAASWMLVSIVKENYDVYLAAKNRSHFWEEISTIMRSKNYFYSGPRCERKFKEAQKLYKDEIQKWERTGAEGPSSMKVRETWFLNEAMHAMMAKDVTVQAPVTVSCGSTSQLQCVREKSMPLLSNRIGKDRLTMLRRPKNKGHSVGKGLALIAKALATKKTAASNVNICQNIESDSSEDDVFQ